jgi:hypothetical protein
MLNARALKAGFCRGSAQQWAHPFLVTYATIFIILLEIPIINEFQRQIVLYKRYIHEIVLIWSGSPAELCRFHEMLGNANNNINLEWQVTPSPEMDLSLEELQEQGQGLDIFPPTSLLRTPEHTPNGTYFASMIYLHCPQNREYS